MSASTHGRRAQPPHVVIVGGGFGGLYAARALAAYPVRITLIDRENYHLFQPLLYQVATAALSPADIAVLLPFSRPPRDSASSLRRGREGRGFGHEDCPKGPRKVARSAG